MAGGDPFAEFGGAAVDTTTAENPFAEFGGTEEKPDTTIPEVKPKSELQQMQDEIPKVTLDEKGNIKPEIILPLGGAEGAKRAKDESLQPQTGEYASEADIPAQKATPEEQLQINSADLLKHIGKANTKKNLAATKSIDNAILKDDKNILDSPKAREVYAKEFSKRQGLDEDYVKERLDAVQEAKKGIITTELALSSPQGATMENLYKKAAYSNVLGKYDDAIAAYTQLAHDAKLQNNPDIWAGLANAYAKKAEGMPVVEEERKKVLNSAKEAYANAVATSQQKAQFIEDENGNYVDPANPANLVYDLSKYVGGTITNIIKGGAEGFEAAGQKYGMKSPLQMTKTFLAAPFFAEKIYEEQANRGEPNFLGSTLAMIRGSDKAVVEDLKYAYDYFTNADVREANEHPTLIKKIEKDFATTMVRLGVDMPIQAFFAKGMANTHALKFMAGIGAAEAVGVPTKYIMETASLALTKMGVDVEKTPEAVQVLIHSADAGLMLGWFMLPKVLKSKFGVTDIKKATEEQKKEAMKEAFKSVTPNDIIATVQHPENPEAAKLQKDILDLEDSKIITPEHAPIFDKGIEEITVELENNIEKKAEADNKESESKITDELRVQYEKDLENPDLPEAAKELIRQHLKTFEPQHGNQPLYPEGEKPLESPPKASEEDLAKEEKKTATEFVAEREKELGRPLTAEELVVASKDYETHLTENVKPPIEKVEVKGKEEKTPEQKKGEKKANKIAADNGFDDATHLLRSVKKRTKKEFKTVQEVPKEVLSEVVEQRGKEIEPHKEVSAAKQTAMKEVAPEKKITPTEKEKFVIVQGEDTGMGKSFRIKNTETGENSKIQFLSKEDAQKQIDSFNKKVEVKSPPEKEAPTAKARQATKDFLKKFGSIDDPNVKKGGFGIDELVDTVFDVYDASIKAGKAVKEAIEDALKHLKESDFYKGFEKKKELEDFIKGQVEGRGETKKRVLTERAYEGEVRAEVKKYLEEKGLTREKVSPQERSAQAEDFINIHGEDIALEAVKSGDVQGATASSIIAKLIKRVDDAMSELEATDVTKLDELAQKQAELIDLLGDKAFKAGEFNSQLAYEYENSDIGYNLVKKIQEYKDANKGEIPADVEKRFSEYDAKIKELNKKIADAEKRAEEAENKIAEKEIEKEKKKAQPRIYGKARIAKGVEDLASALGATKNIIGEIKPSVVKALEDIGRGLIEEGLATAENVAQKVKEYVEKRFAGKVNFDDYSKAVDFDTVVKDYKEFEAQRTESAKKRAQKRIDELTGKMASGDFSKKRARPILEDTELIKLKAEKLRVQELYDKEIHKAELKNRTNAQRAKDSLWDAWGLTRLLSATGEFSFSLIQGLTLTMRNAVRNPKAVGDAFKNAFKLFGSEKRTEEFLSKIKSQEWYPEMKGSKLSLTEPHAKISAREELFYSDWANAIWNTIGQPLRLKSESAWQKWKDASPFKAFERASVGYLDTLRVMRWLEGKQMLERKGIDYRSNPEAYKQMADVINTLTGRASLGKAEHLAEGLTKIFFSPRNWASSIKTVTPYAFYHFGKMRAGEKGWKPSVAQKMAMEDLSIQIALTTSMVMLVKAYLDGEDDPENTVEMNPTSSDFMKIKLGDTRIDPWGGKLQQIVMQARLWADSIKKGSGEKVPLGTPFRTPTAFELLTEMATNKLAPTASLIAEKLSSHKKPNGERVDKYGNPYSLSESVKEKLHPIYWGTIKDLAADGYDVTDALLSFYAFFGGGVQTYNLDTSSPSLSSLLDQYLELSDPKSAEELKKAKAEAAEIKKETDKIKEESEAEAIKYLMEEIEKLKKKKK